MQLAEVLTRVMENKGISLKDLSEGSGVASATIHGWLNGRRVQKIEDLKKVAEILQMSLHELLFDEPDPFEPVGREILTKLFEGDVRVTVQKIERK